MLGSPASPSLLALTQEGPASPGAAVAPPTPSSTSAADAAYDAAFAVLSDARVVTDVPALQQLLEDEGYVRELMDTWTEGDVAAISAFLKPAGRRAFEARWRAARA